MKLLTQNSELRKDGIWNWTIPAWNVKMSDGSWFNCCPNAGVCAKMCYARNGTYLFPVVKAKHLANLEHFIFRQAQWFTDMSAEIRKKRNLQYLRIHDAGDFFSDDYLQSWIDIALLHEQVTFYAYTKEVSRFKRFQREIPHNFRYLFSMGGREDHLIDKEKDRHCDVFPTEQALLDAGYMDQGANDLLAITIPSNKIGIVSNRIPQFIKIQDGLTFGQAQDKRESKRFKG
jgi:hypothetical protein